MYALLSFAVRSVREAFGFSRSPFASAHEAFGFFAYGFSALLRCVSSFKRHFRHPHCDIFFTVNIVHLYGKRRTVFGRSFLRIKKRQNAVKGSEMPWIA